MRRKCNKDEYKDLIQEISSKTQVVKLEIDNKEALELLGKAENLYGDTAWVPMQTTIEAIRRYGSGKMLFGSDTPIDGVDTYFCNPKGERSVYQDYFHVLPEEVDAESYEHLMWKNAVELFGIRLNKKE